MLDGTHAIAFEETVQVLSLAKLVFIKRALVNGVVAVVLWAVAAIKPFLSQCLKHLERSKGEGGGTFKFHFLRNAHIGIRNTLRRNSTRTHDDVAPLRRLLHRFTVVVGVRWKSLTLVKTSCLHNAFSTRRLFKGQREGVRG